MSTSFYVYETQYEPKGDIGMRAIKFRGKSVMPIEELNRIGIAHENGWVKGNLIANGDRPYIVGDVMESNEDYITHEFWVRVIQRTVGQFTGLKDSNGKEIYEGDIVSIDGANETHMRTIVFERGTFHFGHLPDGMCDYKDMKVIGNIHENPELLEVTN